MPYTFLAMVQFLSLGSLRFGLASESGNQSVSCITLSQDDGKDTTFHRVSSFMLGHEEELAWWKFACYEQCNVLEWDEILSHDCLILIPRTWILLL